MSTATAEAPAETGSEEAQVATEATTEATATETQADEKTQPTDEQLQLAHLAEIKDTVSKLLEARASWETAKNTAAELKKAYDNGVDALLSFANQRGIQRELPFGDTEKLADAGNDWESLPLSAAGIEGGRADKMIEAGVDTLGKIAGANLTDIKGFGPEAAGKIADKIADFFKEHPEFCQEGNEDATPTTGGPTRIELLCDLPSASKENLLYNGVEFSVAKVMEGAVIVLGLDDGEEYTVRDAEYTVLAETCVGD